MWSLTFDDRLWGMLQSHLFPGDRDEHGAVVLAGLANGTEGLRLLARDVLLARDGVDYVPGSVGYRALTPMFIASAARRARDEGWAYLAVHCHGGAGQVAFSSVDLASHERGYPALLQITGRPVGGLVVAERAVAGDLWLSDGSRAELRSTTVLGRNTVELKPQRADIETSSPDIYDRQARMFGEQGQRRLAAMRVGVVGLGGAGSMAAEMLARLGVGELVLIDSDRIEPSNLPRVIGSRRKDTKSRKGIPVPGLRRFTEHRPTLKVDIAARTIHSMGLPVKVTALPVDALDVDAVQALCRCDWIVLAADSQRARHLVNAVAHAYLIPIVQVGVKVPVDAASGEVGDVFTVARLVLPSSGCLWCNGLIDPTRLQLEALGVEGQIARAYVGDDAPAPSVITLNGIAVSMALTEMLFSVMGLFSEQDESAPAARYSRYLPRVGRFFQDEPRNDPDCSYCGGKADSLKSRGDDATLPVPLRKPTSNRVSVRERWRRLLLGKRGTK